MIMVISVATLSVNGNKFLAQLFNEPQMAECQLTAIREMLMLC